MPTDADDIVQLTPMQRVLLPGVLIVAASVGLGLSAGKGSIGNLFVGLLIGGLALLALSSRNYLELTEEAMVVRSQFGKGTIAWSDVDDISVDEVLGSRGLTVDCYGKLTRLRVPKEGKLLWVDKDFDEKANRVLDAWRAHGSGTPAKGTSKGGSGRTTPKAKRKDR